MEISRERVPLRNAYRHVGQVAPVRVNSGAEAEARPACPPFPMALNRDALYMTRGDLTANETKVGVIGWRMSLVRDACGLSGGMLWLVGGAMPMPVCLGAASGCAAAGHAVTGVVLGSSGACVGRGLHSSCGRVHHPHPFQETHKRNIHELRLYLFFVCQCTGSFCRIPPSSMPRSHTPPTPFPAALLPRCHSNPPPTHTALPRHALLPRCHSTPPPTHTSLPPPAPPPHCCYSTPPPTLQVAREATSVKAELALLVRDEAPFKELYRAGEDDIVELGPFRVGVPPWGGG